MAKLAIQQVLAAGLKHHEAGRLNEAESQYRKILAQEPNHAEALHLLGVVADQVGRHDVAVELIRRSITIEPRIPEAHSNLGNALQSLGQLDEAIHSFQRALVLKSDFADAHNNLGNAFLAKRQPDKAIACYQRALLLQPNNPIVHHNLGAALQAKGQIDKAIASYQRAVLLRPEYADAFVSLGNAFQAKGEFHKAIAVYRRAVTLRPNLAENHLLLGNALKDQQEIDEATTCCQRALALKPDLADVHNDLGKVLAAKGQVGDAIACFRRALTLRPDFAEAHSSIVYMFYFHPDYNAPAILKEQLLWDERHAHPLRAQWQPHSNDHSPDRRLKVGYVSPHFCDHVIGRNMLPLFREHNREDFEIFCYSSGPRPDTYTRQLQNLADHWRTIDSVDYKNVIEQIRSDDIDILVDLALHMSAAQLLIFARQPAPVQVTFGGYPGGTGLQTMDYRLTDPYLDPQGMTDAHYSEKTIRLADSFWCYDAEAMAVGNIPPPNPLPALTSGHITFGCLNNFTKVNDYTLQLWAQVMNIVLDSRLLLLAPRGEARQNTLNVLKRYGIAADRVEFADRQSSAAYFALYQRIDLGLDCFPYNGHTTSLDSLWMGVPVVTLIGQTAVGRAGFSQLCNLDLKELAADTPEQFVQIASALAADLPRLINLRSTLRQRMQQSPLMDAPRFSRNIESAYRQIWTTWCESH